MENAKEYLAASGIAQGTTIKLVHSGMNAQASEAEVIQACLNEIGLNCDLVSVPDTTAAFVTNQPEDWEFENCRMGS